jgi:hypothetical protein
VHAFGLTRGDAMFRASRYLEHPILPGPDRPGGCRHG